MKSYRIRVDKEFYDYCNSLAKHIEKTTSRPVKTPFVSRVIYTRLVTPSDKPITFILRKQRFVTLDWP